MKNVGLFVKELEIYKMKLVTNPDYRILNNKERIHKKALCYGRMNDGNIGWCKPSKSLISDVFLFVVELYNFP